MDLDIESGVKETPAVGKIGIIVLVLVILAASWYYWSKVKNRNGGNVPGDTLGAKISDKLASPTDKVPDVNPYKANINPFGEAKTNPLKDIYKNPFR